MPGTLFVIGVRDTEQPFERLVRAGRELGHDVLVVDDGCDPRAGVSDRARTLGARAMRHAGARGADAIAALAVTVARRTGFAEVVILGGGDDPSVAAALLQHVRPVEHVRARGLVQRVLGWFKHRRELRYGLPRGTLASRPHRIVV